MSYTPEQIEAKRKNALQKLQQKYKPNLEITNNENHVNSSTEKSKFNSCTPQQIEAKRKEALERLQQKKKHGYGSNIPITKNTDSQNSTFTSNYFKMKSFGTPVKNGPYDHQKIPVQSDVYKLPVEFYGKDKETKLTASLAMISVNRFSVNLSGYSEAVINVMKTIPSRFYDPKTKVWSFLIDHYDMFLEKVKSCVIVDKLPQFVLNACRSKKEDIEYDLTKIDSELFNALMPFQMDGVCFGIDKNGRCMIADDMGLGKTFQALAIGNYYKADWPMLIVTTASMKNVWETTIYNYIPSVPVMHIQYMEQSKDYIDDAKILIVSYELMSRSVDKLMDIGYGVLIIDESHNLKNYKTKSTKAATLLCKRARRVILLTGTPALSRPSELYTQLSLIDDRFFGTFMDYSKRYCDGKQSSFGWDSSGQSNLKELEFVLAKKFMIRRTKEDVLKSLPNKKQEVITLDVNLSQFSIEDQQTLLALAAKYNTVKKDKHAALLTFFSETAKIKIPSVCSYVLQLLESSNKKFLVFAHHQSMLNAIQQVLEKKKKKFIRIDGNTTTLQRKYFVDKFQVDDQYVCALLSITAANAGITLTAAELVLFAELHWNPSILSQAEARAHRIGQKSQVTIQYLIAPGTADDSIWPLLKEKQKTLNKIGLMGESFKSVDVKMQRTDSNENIAAGLGTGTTRMNTLDIRTYCSPSPKKHTNESTLNPEEEFLMDSDMDYLFGEDKQNTDSKKSIAASSSTKTTCMNTSDIRTYCSPTKKDGNRSNLVLEDEFFMDSDLDGFFGEDKRKTKSKKSIASDLSTSMTCTNTTDIRTYCSPPLPKKDANEPKPIAKEDLDIDFDVDDFFGDF